MYNKRNKRSNKHGATITGEFTKTQFIDITSSFETIHPEHPCLSITMYLNFWGGQLIENEGIDNKKIIVNDVMIFLSGFDAKKLHGSKK